MLVGDLQRSGWDSLREFSIFQWLKTTDSLPPKKDGFQPILRHLTLNPQSRQIFPINSQTRWFKPWPFYPRFLEVTSNLWKGHIFTPKRAPAELPETWCVFGIFWGRWLLLVSEKIPRKKNSKRKGRKGIGGRSGLRTKICQISKQRKTKRKKSPNQAAWIKQLSLQLSHS